MWLLVPANLRPGHADHLKVTLLGRGWTVVYFRPWPRDVAMATFHESGTSGDWGGAWRSPVRRQAHRCPSPSSCLPLLDKGRLVALSPLSLPRTRQSLSPFSLLCPLSLPFFSLLGLWSGIRFAGRMTEAGSAWRLGMGGGARPGLSTVLSVFPEPASSWTWPGPAVTEAGFQPWLSSWSICQTGPVTTALAHWSQTRGQLQTEVPPGYSPGDNGIMYISTNHKSGLLSVLRPDHDLWPFRFYPLRSQSS